MRYWLKGDILKMGNQMREYTKPVMNVERFTTDLNFAAGNCDYYKKVNVPCLITQSHDVFYEACGDDNFDKMTTVTITSDVYLNNKDTAVEYLADLSDGTLDGKYGTGNYKLAAGTYLIWTSGNLTHAGLVTPEVQSGINASA